MCIKSAWVDIIRPLADDLPRLAHACNKTGPLLIFTVDATANAVFGAHMGLPQLEGQ